MTTGTFLTLPISAITILRADRQRKELVGLEELAASIRRSGLIHPPLVDESHTLIAGERRLTACRDILGWTHIPVQITDQSDVRDLRRIELEENVRRVDLDWRDQCHAVAEYHDLHVSENPDWTAGDTAEAVGFSPTEVHRRRAISRELVAGNPLVCKADRMSVAANIVERLEARRAAAEQDKMADMVAGLAPAKAPAQSAPEPSAGTAPPYAEPYPTQTPFLHASFLDWAPAYTGPKFNFIHCDFPYGINAQSHDGNSGDHLGTYEDTPEVYWELLNCLASAMDNVVAQSAHAMFWFSMTYYNETLRELSSMGWRVNRFPLLWHRSDNSGILPDPKRGPRRNTETAFLCSRGDRPIVQAVSDTFPYPNRKRLHMSEKPIPMLRHFFRMFVDDTTRMLDPTMGSGNAVVLAESLSAQTSLGLERDAEFYQNAVAAYRREEYDFGD